MKKLLPLVLLLLAACDSTAVLQQDVVAVKVPTVDVRIAKLHRFADLILVNELDIWLREGYTCEKKYVETELVDWGNGVKGEILKELHACWRIEYETILQPNG